MDFGVGGCCIAARIAEDDFVLSLAFISVGEEDTHSLLLLDAPVQSL